MIRLRPDGFRTCDPCLRSVEGRSFRRSVTRKNRKSRYKKAAERALAQP